MPEITVASTTDSQDAINASAGVAQEVTEKETPEGEEPETQPASEADENHVSKSAVQKRIDKLTREKYESRKEIDGLKERLLAIEKGGKPQPVIEEKPIAEAAAPKPTPDQFPSYEDFVEALADWKADQKLNKIETDKAAKAAEASQQNAQKAVFDKYNERIEEAKERYDDFEEVVGKAALIPNEVALAIVELENGPDVAYYLGKNTAICKELMNMSILKALTKIGSISQNLMPTEEADEPGGDPVPKVTTRAKTPPRPVAGSSTRSTVPLDELPYQQYAAIRAKQEKERYRR